MAYVRFQSTFHNTTGTDVLWQIDIVDTVGSGGTLQLSTDSDPTEEFEGLPQDLKPGIYPTSVRFAVYIEHGLHEGIINSVLTSDEGRFKVRLYKDSILQFIGWVLPDQCEYEEEYFPYRFWIEATDGLHRLATTDYAAQLGTVVYQTVEDIDFSGTTYNATPLSLAGNGWTMVEHYSINQRTINDIPIATLRVTTFARLTYYATNSPGSGWIDDGNGLWVKAVSYDNEVITTQGSVYYRLTRDIITAPQKTINAYIQECIEATGLGDEYGAVMYDQCSEWYEQSMGSLTDDPFSQIRVSEAKFVNQTYQFVLQEIAKQFYLRVYYSLGRYHIEQITTREHVNPKRWTYQADGTLVGTESTSLDLNLSSLSIVSGVGGKFKSLAPLKEVRVTFNTDTSNLLQGVWWDGSRQGMRYLGRIPKEQADHLLRISIPNELTSTFDSTTMDALPSGLQAIWSRHTATVNVQVRIVSQASGFVYYLTSGGVAIPVSTWETTEADFEKQSQFGFVIPFSEAVLSQTNFLSVELLSEALPENVGDLFDVYVSVVHSVAFEDTLGSTYWNVTNAGDFVHDAKTGESQLISRDNDDEQLNVESELTYTIENTVNNSLDVEVTVLFGDIGMEKDRVEINDGSAWVATNGWSVNGTGTAYDLPELLAREIISLRYKPRRIYAASLLTSIPTPDKRIVKDGVFYLPLRVTRNGDLDSYTGEFLEIYKEPSVPGGYTAVKPGIAPPNLGTPPADQDIVTPPVVLVLETNEIITPATYTECDIVNTLQVHVPSGAVCRIQHPTTPSTFQNVTLTQAIEPTDTVMYFTSVAIAGTFPDASPIYVEPQAQPDIPVGITNFFDFFAESYYGNAVTAPSYDFTLLSGIGTAAIDKRILVERHGKRIYYNPAASTLDPVEQMKFWEWDSDAPGSFFFAIPLDNESLLIRAR